MMQPMQGSRRQTYEVKTYSIEVGSPVYPCNCVGPQGGCPVCPCEMRARGIFQRDGRWVEPARGERDLGAVWTKDMVNTANSGEQSDG